MTSADPGPPNSVGAGDGSAGNLDGRVDDGGWTAARVGAFTDLVRAPVITGFLTTDWASRSVDSDRPIVATDLPAPGVFAARRRRLADAFGQDVLVIPAGTAPTRSNDIAYRFRPYTAHVWACGNQAADAVLVITADEQVLYCRPRSGPDTDEFWSDRRTGEFWTGPRLSAAELADLLDIDCRPLADLPAALDHCVGRTIRAVRGLDPELDRQLPAIQNTAVDGDLEIELARQRLVKDDWEIGQLTAAVQSTLLGFDECVRDWANVQRYGERWIEGTFDRRSRVDGNGVGYPTIAAAGRHASTLHWIENDGVVRDGQVVLMDMGVEARSLYTADITRTVPASGRWTPLQRTLYQLVLDAQQAGISAVAPGAPFRAFHRACVEVLVDGLIDLGLLPGSRDQSLDPASSSYARWVLCGSGHMLGLDVHDCRGGGADQSLDLALQPGNVLTVEPGLYFQADDEKVPAELRGVGIRIEDDLQVTSTGAVNLSAALPRTADDIERWMAGDLDPISRV